MTLPAPTLPTAGTGGRGRGRRRRRGIRGPWLALAPAKGPVALHRYPAVRIATRRSLSTRTPSMFLFMMIATCYGVLQLAVLGSLTRSVRIANLLLAVTVGLYGCGAVADLLQILYTRTVASLTGT